MWELGCRAGVTDLWSWWRPWNLSGRLSSVHHRGGPNQNVTCQKLSELWVEANWMQLSNFYPRFILLNYCTWKDIGQSIYDSNEVCVGQGRYFGRQSHRNLLEVSFHLVVQSVWTLQRLLSLTTPTRLPTEKAFEDQFWITKSSFGWL